MRSELRPIATAVLLALTSSAGPALARGQEPVPERALLVEQTAGLSSLRAEGGEVFHTTTAEVEDARLVAVPGGAGSVALWTERSGAEHAAHYAVDLEGNGFSRPRATDYEVLMKRARFDPAVAAPDFRGSSMGEGGELRIVQFVCPPLEAFLDELEAMGASVHHYVPRHARIVRMSDELVERVEALPFVRWVGPYHPEYRLEPALLEALASPDPLPVLRYYVQVLEKGPRQKAVVAQRIAAIGGTVVARIPDGYRLEALLSADQLVAVARMDEVLYVDRWSPPEEDMNHVRELGGAAYLETVAGFTGEGVRGEVMDGNVRTTHAAFQSNPILIHGGTGGDSDHGTKTTGCIFGDGTGAAGARATLPDGQPIFADYGFLLNRYGHTAELVQAPYNAVFQSNSWGGSLTVEYTSTSMEMDDILLDFDIVILQSQSNNGSQFSRPQAWAKNIVSVGGIRHYDTLTLSDDAWAGGASIGPAIDGRIKPDISFWYDDIWTTDNDSDTDYTTGFNGTSAATPCAAGYVGLIQQMWSEGVFGNSPSGSTVFERRAKASTARALLINTARQYGFTGAGHDLTRVHQGWGLPDVKTLYDLREKCFVVDEEQVLEPFETATYQLLVQPGEPAFRATLVYLDVPGTTSTFLHRINDLSLRVTSPTGVVYWGNNGLLTGNWSTAGGASNTLDVVENVFVSAPEAGTWKAEVIADELNGDTHVETPGLDADFALVVTGVEGDVSCPTPLNYCTPKQTSIGSLPTLLAAGTPSVGTNSFQVVLTEAVPFQNALVFWSDDPGNNPFQGGTLCVQPPVQRGTVQQIDGFGQSIWSIDLSTRTPGDTEYFQVWFRDPADPTGFGIGLSDGLEVTYCE